MKNKFDKLFWESKYEENKTGWDIGEVSTPLKTYFNQIDNKNLKILIPGGGNCYEAEYLHEQGFKNLHVIDIANQPLLNLKNRFPDFPEKKLINDNFFNHEGSYDLIIEQTFFCALTPTLRKPYVNKMHDLLTTNGKIVGLLFDFEFTTEGPPFGGSIKEYIKLFYAKFEIEVLERCYNSIKPRDGRELFFITKKL